MSKKNKRIGVGMKPRGVQPAKTKEVSNESQTSAAAVQAEGAAEVVLEASERTENDGSQEAETVQNLASSVAVSQHSLSDLMEKSKGAESPQAPSKCGGEHGEPACADPNCWLSEPSAESKAAFDAELARCVGVAAMKEGLDRRGFQMTGERADGTFGLVLSVREGMIQPIREQAGYEKQTAEEWVSERFGEWLEQWWAAPQSR